MKPANIGASFRKPVGKAREKQMKHDAYERRKRQLKLEAMDLVTQEYEVTTRQGVAQLILQLQEAGYDTKLAVDGKTVLPAYYSLWSDGKVTRGDTPQDVTEVMSSDFKSTVWKRETIVKPYKAK